MAGMRLLGHRKVRRGRVGQAHRPSRLLATTTVLTGTVLAAGTLVGVLAVTAGPAYADIATSTYTIGSPSPAVTNVVASPSGASSASSTDFEVTLTVNPSLSGGGADWVSVVPSTSLGSTPSSIALVGSSCVQGGTNGGAYSATGITVDLNASCSLSSGSKAEVDFTADAPVSTGTFSFAVTTSKNSSPATSNTVTVTAAGPVLTAATYAFGANAVYTVNNANVAGLSASGTSLTLTAAPTVGTEKIAFVNSGAGGAGYSVTVTPSGGSAGADTVTNASASGATVTLTLATALVNGDALVITATGSNPASSASAQADHITVAPGNGTPKTTNSIAFGGSVTALAVAPSTLVAGASATYSVGFTASDASSSGGSHIPHRARRADELLKRQWHRGHRHHPELALCRLRCRAYFRVGHDPAHRLDQCRRLHQLAHRRGHQPDFAGDHWPLLGSHFGRPGGHRCARLRNVANASPGVLVTVNPTTAAAVATYTIVNVRASGALAGGTATIKLEAPSVPFPNNPAFYGITDSTNSGVRNGQRRGHRRWQQPCDFTVPNTINSGDVLTLTVADVVNPSTASASDSITLVGAVTGPAPSAATTTTAAPPTTTTTTKPPVKKVQHPTIADPTSKADVSKAHLVHVELKCTVLEACKGYVTLTDVTTVVVGLQHYSIRAGKKGIVVVHLRRKGILFVAGAKHHTIKVTAKVSVTGGKTIKERTTLVGL